MSKIKVRAHTSYLGHTGYASHARGFFRSLSRFCDLRIRNFNWDSGQNLSKYVNSIDLEILDQITLTGADNQRFDYPIQDIGEFQSIGFKNRPDGFIPDVDIVLIEPSHYYFFEEYRAKTKIAYTVWESTEVSEVFLNIIKKFDAVWVVSQWHKDCLIKQGVDSDKVWVVPEGVDSDFNPDNQYPKVDEYNDNRFKFLFFGRWDYRKSVPEIIKSFLEEFSPEEPVDLVLSADNPFSIDGLSSTEERLEKNGLVDNRIKVKHFPSREEYLSYLHNGHAMITCARSEGWNIPLCEAIAAGIPVTYSDWGAQLEFCQGIACPVKIVGEFPVSSGKGLIFENGYDFPGNYCLPDYNDLKLVLRRIYSDYFTEKDKALQYSKILRDKFNWDNIGQVGFKALKETIDFSKKITIVFNTQEDYEEVISNSKSKSVDTLLVTNSTEYPDVNFMIYNKGFDSQSLNLALDFARNLGYRFATLCISGDYYEYDLKRDNQSIIDSYNLTKQEYITNRINLSFVDGASVTINGGLKKEYLVQFINNDNQQVIFETRIQTNNWCGPNRKYFTNWLVRVTDLSDNRVVLEHIYDAKDKKVLICFESSSLGDTVSWLPAVEEFRKKWGSQVVISTFLNHLFEKEYPELQFVQPGSVVHNLYALYRIGWYYNGDQIDPNRHPADPKDRPMQATSFDILGIEHQQIRTRVSLPDEPSRFNRPYVCIGVHATAQAKYWNNPNGWNDLIEWFDLNGYDVVLISREHNGYMGNQITHPKLIDKSGNLPLEDRLVDLKHATMFIGVGSGLSWLAWAAGTPVALISGFSNPSTEFLGEDVIRIFSSRVCNSCFNRHRLDPSDWNWCPDHKSTDRQFECTKTITPQRVIFEISGFLAYLESNKV